MDDLIVPDPHETIRLHAAAYAVGLLHSWDLPVMADRVLGAGMYSDALFELSCITSPAMSEVGLLLRRSLAELGVAPPTLSEAAWTVARRCMELLAHSDRPPRELLGMLEGLADATRDEFPDRSYIGAGLDLRTLIGTFWSYDEPGENFYEPEQRYIESEEERHAILDREARAEARAWLERHPPG